jgi:RHS repeat-associated protein
VASYSADGSSISGATRYDAYGLRLGSYPAATSPDPWGYQDRLALSPDPAHPLYDFAARSYDPGLGTFTSLDSLQADPANPLSLNRFLYAGGNPTSYVDPSGHAYVSGTDLATSQRVYTTTTTSSGTSVQVVHTLSPPAGAVVPQHLAQSSQATVAGAVPPVPSLSLADWSAMSLGQQSAYADAYASTLFWLIQNGLYDPARAELYFAIIDLRDLLERPGRTMTLQPSDVFGDAELSRLADLGWYFGDNRLALWAGSNHSTAFGSGGINSAEVGAPIGAFGLAAGFGGSVSRFVAGEESGAALGPRIPEYGGGGSAGTTRITRNPSDIEHVMNYHFEAGAFADPAKKSIFARGEDLSSLVDAAEQVTPVAQQGGGTYARIVWAGRMVGFERLTGQGTMTYTVITRADGSLVTAYPGIPRY